MSFHCEKNKNKQKRPGLVNIKNNILIMTTKKAQYEMSISATRCKM